MLLQALEVTGDGVNSMMTRYFRFSSHKVGDRCDGASRKACGFIALGATGSSEYADLTVAEDRATLGSDPSAVTEAIRQRRAAGKSLRPPALLLPEALKRQIPGSGAEPQGRRTPPTFWEENQKKRLSVKFAEQIGRSRTAGGATVGGPFCC